MTTREELAASATEHLPLRGGIACDCGWSAGLSLNDTRSDQGQHLAHVALVLLDSPALARMFREAKADGWDVGYLRGVLDECQDSQPADNPYRDQTEENN